MERVSSHHFDLPCWSRLSGEIPFSRGIRCRGPREHHRGIPVTLGGEEGPPGFRLDGKGVCSLSRMVLGQGTQVFCLEV
jgi:hypothetical protein